NDLRSTSNKADRSLGEVVDGCGSNRMPEIKVMAHGLGLRNARQHSITEVFDIAPGPQLAAIAVDGDIFASKRPDAKMPYCMACRATWTVDVERADDDGWEQKVAMVRPYLMFAQQFRRRVAQTWIITRPHRGQRTFVGIHDIAIDLTA